MTIQSPLDEGLYVHNVRPDRRWIRFFIKHYSILVGVTTSLIIIASLYAIDPRLTFVALAGYWVYIILKVRNRTNPKWVVIYKSVIAQFVRTLFLIAGVSILLNYLYTNTAYLENVKVDTLWLLYLLAISVISQRGSRIWFVLTLGVVITSLYFVSPPISSLHAEFPYAITHEFIAKSFWLTALSGLTYILLRYMSDAVADMNLIVNVQNHIREMEGKFLRTNKPLNELEYLENTVEIIKKDLKFDHVNVYRLDTYDQQLTCIAAACSDGKQLVSERYTVKLLEGESIIGYVARTGHAYVSNNTLKDAHYLPTAAFPETKAELVVPIRSRNRLYGVLDIQVHQSDFFLDQDLKAIEILANNIGWVVDNSEQFEHINWLNRIIEKIAMPILTQKYLDDTLQEIADVAQQELAADLVMVYSFDPGANEGVLGPICAGQPIHPELLQHVSHENDNVVQRLINGGDRITCNENLDELELDEHPLFSPSPTHRATGRPTFIARENIKSNAIIRLLNNDQCVGVLFLNFRKTRSFSFWDKRRYFSFAHLAALSIQKMHSQKHEVQLEMADLSKRIHDTLIGDTLGLYKVLDNIEVGGKIVERKKLRHLLALAKEMTDQLHNDIRYISRLLESTQTDDLETALDKLSMSFHHIFKLKMDLSKWKIDQAYLTPKLSKELFLVVREAITNSAKHAHATAITITGGILSDVLRISVTDNGRGFDTEHTRRANGLASMRYRMKELGGEFEIDSELGKGTTIKIAMPVSRTV